MKKATVVNCKKLSIMKDPSCEETYGETVEIVPAGTVLKVDTTDTCWSWTDKQYYKVKTSTGAEGYAITDGLLIKETNSGNENSDNN